MALRAVGPLVLLLLLAGLAQAASPPRVDLVETVCPARLALAPGETGNISVDATNPNRDPLVVVPAALLAPANATWTATAQPSRLVVEPHATRSFVFEVRAPAAGANATLVALAANATTAPGADAPRVRLVLLAPGAIAPAEPAPNCTRTTLTLPAADLVPPPTRLAGAAAGGGWVLAVGGGALAAGAAGWALVRVEDLRLRALAPLLALFTRLAPPRLLDQEVRQRVYDAIRREPGIHFSQLRERLRLSTGVLDHHARILERAGLIASRREGRFRAYYTREAPLPPPPPEPLGESAQRLLGLVETSREVSYAEAMERLGLSKPSISHHVKVLEKRGLVELVQRPEDGRWVVRPSKR